MVMLVPSCRLSAGLGVEDAEGWVSTTGIGLVSGGGAGVEVSVGPVLHAAGLVSMTPSRDVAGWMAAGVSTTGGLAGAWTDGRRGHKHRDANEHGRPLLAGATLLRIELKVITEPDRSSGHACTVQVPTPMAAWRRASERVGWGWQVRAMSSDAAENSMATQYSAIISLTEGPIM